MVVTSPEDLTPDRLTERLRANGALPCGRVNGVHAGERRTTILSTIVPLRVDYSPDAPTEAPTRLLLKATRGGLDASLHWVGEREVAFYRQAAPLMPGGTVPPLLRRGMPMPASQIRGPLPSPPGRRASRPGP